MIELSEWLLFNAKSAIFQWKEQVNIQWDDDEIRFVLVHLAELDFYSANSLKRQSSGRHVPPLGHIILIPSQPVFVLSPWCCVHSGEVTNTNCIFFGLTMLRPPIAVTSLVVNGTDYIIRCKSSMVATGVPMYSGWSV